MSSLRRRHLTKDALGTSKSPPTPSADDIIRFGSFEVDPGAGELRRSGLRIRLGGQPFDVLVTLLQKPGQVVTREELHQKLWAHDTFVDFEHGLNKAINKVREALGDVADNPRFIETLPRRGYRFLAPVIRPAPEMSVADTFAEVKEPAPIAVEPVQSNRRYWIWLCASALVTIILAAIVIGSRPAQPPKVLHYTQLTNDGLKKTADVNAALATDGSRIYFWEQDAQQGLIAQVSVTGGNVSTVARFKDVRFSALDYSAARSELLFSFDFQTPLWALRIPEGSVQRRIGDFVVDDAAWSPDGQSIAYGSANKLTLVKADGSQPRLLATLQNLVDVMYPRWSPDGKLLRFSLNSFKTGRTSIWEIAADGTDLHPLFPDWHARNDYGGSWTSDGRYFVFGSRLSNGHGAILVSRNKKLLPPSAPESVELTAGPMSFSAPLVSMDGKKILPSAIWIKANSCVTTAKRIRGFLTCREFRRRILTSREMVSGSRTCWFQTALSGVAVSMGASACN